MLQVRDRWTGHGATYVKFTLPTGETSTWWDIYKCNTVIKIKNQESIKVFSSTAHGVSIWHSWWSCSIWKKVKPKRSKYIVIWDLLHMLELAFFFFFPWKALISRACLSWRLCLVAYRQSDAFIKWTTALLITAHQGGLRAAVVCYPTVRQHLLKFWSQMSLENGLCFLRSLSLDDLHAAF